MRAIALPLVLLGACAAPAPPGLPANPGQTNHGDTCGAARFAALIGARADRIDRAGLPPLTRIITPDMMVTQDFSPDRLNIMVGADGVIGSVRCF